MSALTPVIGNAYNSNKIRIESSSLIRDLNSEISIERGEFRTSNLDSNKVAVEYSPVDMIDNDILAQFADFNFDDFIGDPADQWNDSYPKLKTANDVYWQKYDNANNF